MTFKVYNTPKEVAEQVRQDRLEKKVTLQVPGIDGGTTANHTSWSLSTSRSLL